MTHSTSQIALLGECMLELSNAPGSTRYQLGVAGDTYNTAAGLAQLGVSVEYVTALGSDRYSEVILDDAQQRNIGSQFIQRNPSATPGLYLIENDDQGERSFSYWRENSAAHQLLRNGEQLDQLLSAIESIPNLFFSGITLALCGEDGRKELLQWLPRYRAQGGRVIYDSNYRETLWPDLESAQRAHAQILEQVDLFLPSAEDIAVLHSNSDMLALTSKEIVSTDGDAPVSVILEGALQHIAIDPVASVVDTTGAGDAFNAGYLAARLRNIDAVAAVNYAAKVAAQTIAHRGAILPTETWSELREALEKSG